MNCHRSALACAAVLLGTSLGFAQTVNKESQPSQHWAATAVASLQARNILPADRSGKKLDGNKPVTRYELAVVLWKLVQHIEASGKQPRGKSSVLRELDGAQSLRRLIAGGYIESNSPLAKEPTRTIGEDELAQVLVKVIARVQEKMVPVTPDSKKSIPMDRHPGGGA